MKALFVAIMMMVLCHYAPAQTALEVLGGNKQTHYLSYWQKDLDTKGRFNFFSVQRFAVDYKEASRNNYTLEGQLTYQLSNWLGISAGGSFEDNVFSPSLGLSIGSSWRDLTVETYPTVQWSNPTSLNLFGLVLYTPQFNKTWGLFSQLIVSTNAACVRTEESARWQHLVSNEMLRVGLNYNERLQFGIGTDLYQFGQSQGSFSNWGLFIRFQVN